MDSTTGYQVGSQCFSSYQEALDYQMSSVVPSITSSGSLLYPEKQGQGWFFNNQSVQLTFPECDPASGYQDGMTVGAELVALMFVAFVIKQCIRMLRQTDKGDSDD